MNDDERQKLMLEDLFIDVIPLYENLRNEVLKRIMDQINSKSDFLLEKYYLDYNFFRREKKKPNLNQIDKFEYQIKIEQEKRKKVKEKQLIVRIFENNTNFSDFHKKRLKFLKKAAQNAKFFLENVQKKTEQIEVIEQRKRIEALKSKQMDEYMNLLKKTKQRRILDILEETENFLREIGLKIYENKGPDQNMPI